jgi:hypothetical protein
MSLKRLKINSKYEKNKYSAHRILPLGFREAPPCARWLIEACLPSPAEQSDLDTTTDLP